MEVEIYQALKEDHETIRILVNRLVHLNPEDEDERAIILDQLQLELLPYTHAEESVFYNSFKAIDSAKELISPRVEEHMLLEDILRKLAANGKIDGNWDKEAIHFKQLLEKHFSEEQAKIFPVAHTIFTLQEANMMGRAYEEMKPEIRDGSFLQHTLDTIASLMPPRFAGPMRNLGSRY